MIILVNIFCSIEDILPVCIGLFTFKLIQNIYSFFLFYNTVVHGESIEIKQIGNSNENMLALFKVVVDIKNELLYVREYFHSLLKGKI